MDQTFNHRRSGGTTICVKPCFCLPEVYLVVVQVDRHQRDARLDQAPGQEQVLAIDVPAVSVAEKRVLTIDPKSAGCLGEAE